MYTGNLATEVVHRDGSEQGISRKMLTMRADCNSGVSCRSGVSDSVVVV